MSQICLMDDPLAGSLLPELNMAQNRTRRIRTDVDTSTGRNDVVTPTVAAPTITHADSHSLW